MDLNVHLNSEELKTLIEDYVRKHFNIPQLRELTVNFNPNNSADITIQSDISPGDIRILPKNKKNDQFIS